MPSKANLFILILLVILGINFCRAIWLRPRSEYAALVSANAANSSVGKSASSSKQILLAIVKSDPQKSGYRTSFFVLPTDHTQMLEVSEYKPTGVGYGDSILLVGKIKLAKSTPGTFDYSDYLSAQNVFGQTDNPQIFAITGPQSWSDILIRKILDFKQLTFYRLTQEFSSRPAGLLLALMFGDKHQMDSGDKDNFNNIGAAHMIAVSGFKLTLLLIWLDLLRRWISKSWLLLIAAVIIFFYLGFSGFAAAVLRAAIMNSAYVLAKYAGRKYSILPALLLTAALLSTLHPLILLFDIGFLLSFSGILGIIFFGPLLHRALRFIKWRRIHYLKGIFISGLAAQLATAPLIALFFQQFNPYAPLINMIVVPLLVPAILGGYLLLSLALLPLLGILAAWICLIALNFLLWFAGICANLPGASISVNIGWKTSIIFYIFEIFAYFFWIWLFDNNK